MKAVVRNLIFFMLIAPAFAQLPSIPFRNPDSDMNGEPAITKKQAEEPSAEKVEKLAIESQSAQIPSISVQNTENSVSGETATVEEPIQKSSTDDFQVADMRAPLFRTLGGLGLVVFLIIAIYFAAKRFAPHYFTKNVSEKALKVIETLSMGDKRSISLIEVANNRFIVGNTPHQINLLAALPESVDSVSAPEALSVNPKQSAGGESKSSFRNLYEMEKKRPAQHMVNPLPEDIRVKMRQLREALER